MSTESEPLSGSRRRVMGWMARAILSLWALGGAWIVSAFLKPPRSRRSLAEKVLKVGPVDSIPVGGAQLVRRSNEPVFIVRAAEESWVGLSGVCTHLQCVLRWNEEGRRLDCPCHRASFDLNGNVLQGPAPAALRRFRVETQRGQIHLHV